MTDSRGDAARRPITYRAAGVDIDAAESLVGRFRALAAATARPEVLAGVAGGIFGPPELLGQAGVRGVGQAIVDAHNGKRLFRGKISVALRPRDVVTQK